MLKLKYSSILTDSFRVRNVGNEIESGSEYSISFGFDSCIDIVNNCSHFLGVTILRMSKIGYISQC